MPHLHESPSRPAVILLHASGSSPRQWDRLAERLQPAWRVHAVELFGHGSRKPWPGPGPLTLAEEAARIVPLLAQAGQAHLVGHSYGAAVALKLASLHPASVRSVTAYEPVLFRWLREVDGNAELYGQFTGVAEAIRRHLARDDPHGAAQRFIDFWSGAGTWDELPLVRREAMASRMRAVLDDFDALFAEPLRPADLARLTVPALFMTGGETLGAMRRLAGIARHLLPRADHVVLPGLDHMGPLAGADEVNPRIVAFLDECVRTEDALAPLRAVA